ncbi:MAG: S-adenosylmethionine decarboxylase proenzyme [Hyphomonadaceae bacterium]|nr:S-adenosylmethionine decarboxylase proenzyme [Clostridia bacterium]
MKLNTLGRHILVEYYNCNTETMANPELIDKYMCQAAREAQATIVTSVFHHFDPWGVSGAVIISESHLTIHTWPEYGYAAVDLFTCGDIDPWAGFDYLEKAFEAERSESVEMPRGMVEKIRKYHPHPEQLGEITYKPEGVI